MTKKLAISIFMLVLIFLSSFLITDEMLSIHLIEKNQSPSLQHLFGTDWLGRDMFLRTWKAMHVSIGVGFITAIATIVISFILSVLASFHSKTDQLIGWLTDLFLSLPHLVTLILVSFVLGGGFKGVVIGLILTHWPSLTRVLRAEILQLQQTTYVQMSQKLGKSIWWRARHHYIPHLLPQMLVGFTLVFPHAILHEASITFLGFGLSSEDPAIGIILAESMQYLSSGMWWLAFFPGAVLLLVVLIFQFIANQLQKMLEKDDSYEFITRD